MQASEGPKVCCVWNSCEREHALLCWECVHEREGRESSRVSKEQLSGHELRSGGSKVAAVALASPAAVQGNYRFGNASEEHVGGAAATK